MGLLRIYLAIVVLLSHCPQGTIIPKISHPALAVQCFYAISGFYMQLLVNQFSVTHDGWVKDFYINRIIRIFPTYLFILLITLVFLPTALSYVSDASFKDSLLFWFNNLFIITQGPARFYNLPITVLPQSWTLSLEMMFYLLAPYLLTKNNRPILLLILTSIVCRITLCSFDLYTNHWFYEFFPSEISIFLLGAIAYRFYAFYLAVDNRVQAKFKQAFSLAVCFFLAYFTLHGWHKIPGGQWDGKTTLGVPLKYWTVLLATIASLPFAFYLTKKSALDRFIGEFSYPLYLGHFFFLFLIEKKIAPQYQNVVVLILTLLLSIFIMYVIEKPLSRLRQKLKTKISVQQSAITHDLVSESS